MPVAIKQHKQRTTAITVMRETYLLSSRACLSAFYKDLNIKKRRAKKKQHLTCGFWVFLLGSPDLPKQQQQQLCLKPKRHIKGRTYSSVYQKSNKEERH